MKTLLLILTKNTTMKRLLLILLCLPMIFSCGEKKIEKDEGSLGWSQEEKDTFRSECIKNAINNAGQSKAERYCNCMLGASMSRWKSGEEADKAFLKMTYEDILKMIEPCK